MDNKEIKIKNVNKWGDFCDYLDFINGKELTKEEIFDILVNEYLVPNKLTFNN